MSEVLEKLEQIEMLLREQKVQGKEILTFKETCKYLDLSESYLYKLTSGRRIPHFSPNNKKLFFKKNELDQWLLRNKRETGDRTESLAADYLVKNPLNQKL